MGASFRAARLLVPALALVSACSLVESFDGYAGGGAPGAVGAAQDAGAGSHADASADAAQSDAALAVDAGDGGGGGGGADSSSAVVIGHLYVLGGIVASAGAEAPTDDVLYADVHDDGTVGTFNPLPALPRAISGGAAATASGVVFSIGGALASGSFSTEVDVAHVGTTGALGVWYAAAALATPRYGHAAVSIGEHVYAVGGAGSSSGLALASTEGATSNGAGVLSSWSAGPSLPAPRYNAAIAASGGFLYVSGGGSAMTPSSYSPSVFVGATDATSGSVTGWVLAGSFGDPRGGHASVASSGHLYVIGGESPQQTLTGEIDVAPISAGAVGSFAPLASGLPFAVYGHGAAIVGDFMFVVGGRGSGGGLRDAVHVARIAGDGTLSSWTRVGTLPSGRAYHALVGF